MIGKHLYRKAGKAIPSNRKCHWDGIGAIHILEITLSTVYALIAKFVIVTENAQDVIYYKPAFTCPERFFLFARLILV